MGYRTMMGSQMGYRTMMGSQMGHRTTRGIQTGHQTTMDIQTGHQTTMDSQTGHQMTMDSQTGHQTTMDSLARRKMRPGKIGQMKSLGKMERTRCLDTMERMKEAQQRWRGRSYQAHRNSEEQRQQGRWP